MAKTGGRRIREDVLERDYCLAWFLAGLAISDLLDSLAFKGGTALKRCYFGNYRFSEDLDFTLTEDMTFENLRQRLEVVYARVKDESGIVFQFDREDNERHSNSYTFYLKYNGPLPKANDVKVDVTLKERIVFPLENRAILRAYEEFSDIPENRIVYAYSLDEVATEKIMALADPARNEPRDLYDLWYLSTEGGVDIEALMPALKEKLEFRKKLCEGLFAAIEKKEARLKNLWQKRLEYQMATLPEFDEVFRAVRRTLRQAGLP